MARERYEREPGRALGGSIAPTDEARIAIASSPDGDVAVVVVDPGGDAREVELFRVDPRGAPTLHARLALGEPGSLFALRLVAPELGVLLRARPCAREAERGVCLFAWALALEPSAVVPSSHPEVIALEGFPHTMRIAVTNDRILLARGHERGVLALDTLRLDRRGPSAIVTTRRLGEGLDPSRGSVEILALAASSSSYAVLSRQGTEETSEAGVTLSTPMDEHVVPELDEALVIESIAIFAGGIDLIAAFEFREPSWLRVGFDGELGSPPRPIPAGEEVPIPFADRRVARLDPLRPGSVEIRDGAGHETAPTVALEDDLRMADVARVEGGFLVASLARDGTASVERLGLVRPERGDADRARSSE